MCVTPESIPVTSKPISESSENTYDDVVSKVGNDYVEGQYTVVGVQPEKVSITIYNHHAFIIYNSVSKIWLADS